MSIQMTHTPVSQITLHLAGVFKNAEIIIIHNKNVGDECKARVDLYQNILPLVASAQSFEPRRETLRMHSYYYSLKCDFELVAKCTGVLL